jgi:hypothetical protein
MARALFLTVCLVSGVVLGGSGVVFADQIFSHKPEQLVRIP